MKTFALFGLAGMVLLALPGVMGGADALQGWCCWRFRA
jgi:hypothetical protein